MKTDMSENQRSALARRLGHRFRREEWLAEALRHSSCVNEQADPGLRSNERLEFLGDAVLNLVAGHLLMDRYPEAPEGELSRMRANLVNEARLASVGEAIDLGLHLSLGRGEEQDGGRGKPSILADALEALVAAVYLDGGFRAARRVVERHLAAAVAALSEPAEDGDFKSRLQERVQSDGRRVPHYRLVEATGPDHDKTFRVELRLDGMVTEGTGKSKKAAEQAAAREALERLAEEGPPWDRTAQRWNGPWRSTFRRTRIRRATGGRSSCRFSCPMPAARTAASSATSRPLPAVPGGRRPPTCGGRWHNGPHARAAGRTGPGSPFTAATSWVSRRPRAAACWRPPPA